MEDRREGRKLEANDPDAVRLGPPPLAPRVPLPIPWIATEPVPAVPPTDVLACVARYSTIRSLEMSGSYPLSDEAIDEAMTRTSPGNYALGYMDGDTFNVFYVGRSDSDVRQRLHEWVGMPSRYDRYAPASRAAWASRRSGRLMPLGRPSLGRVTSGESSYTRFAYSYAPSAEAAFEKECRNYDDFGGSGELDNEAAPSRAA